MTHLGRRPDNTLFLHLHIQPKASRNRVAGLHGGAVKLCITAPPVDNQANRAVIAFLAKLFKIPKSAVTIHSGHQGRHKTVILANISLTEAAERLGGALEK